MLVDQKPAYQTLTPEDYTAMAGPDWPLYSEFVQGVKIPKFVADELDEMLGQVSRVKQQLSNFCISPFFSREYPGNSYCCLLPENVDIEQVREDMLANKRTPDCQACWVLEDAGVLSDRQIKNRTLDFYSNIDITALYKKAQAGNHKVSHYKVTAGNYCNATCVTCNAGNSSAWGQLLNKDKKIFPIMLDADSQMFDVDYESAEFVSFTGGESTMIRTHWVMLEKLVAAGNTDCGISFVTNGSFTITPRQQELLSKFRSVVFCFSIDGTGPVFEYLRYPLSWDQLCSNVQWVKDNNFMASVSYTISNLNILYHEQTIKWFKKMDLPYLENIVYNPTYFSPRALNQSIKDKILSTTDNSTMHTFLSDHTDVDQANYQQFLIEIQQQDQLKGIAIENYLPELVDMINAS